jgi:YHS domain-containing protein
MVTILVSYLNKRQQKEIAMIEKDPVCGMDVDPKTAAAQSEYQGKTYYFCSTGCKKDFDKDPAKFVGKPASTAAI